MNWQQIQVLYQPFLDIGIDELSVSPANVLSVHGSISKVIIATYKYRNRHEKRA